MDTLIISFKLGISVLLKDDAHPFNKYYENEENGFAQISLKRREISKGKLKTSMFFILFTRQKNYLM